MIKSGMEVGLTSPNSEKLVALGTVQKVATDDYIEVVVNMVLHSTTLLPEPRGRMKIIRHAEAHCIRWPKKFVSLSVQHQSVSLLLLQSPNLCL